jgi:predicted esterase
MSESDPHAGIAVLRAGAPVARARAAGLLLHGRGGSARDILTLARAIDRPDVAWVAPQAAGNTWYPRTFLAPFAENEPWLSSALAAVGRHVEELARDGVPPERVVLMGFSQGGCLALEHAARHARRWGGAIGLSSGLIGPPGAPRDYPGSLAGTPIFLGCSDRDPHVPLERVEESAAALARLGGDVTTRIYPGMGHTVNDDEIAHVRAIVDRVTGGEPPGGER